MAGSKDTTVPEHFPDTSDTSLCAPGVPEIRGDLDSLLDDIPRVVIDGLRNWHKLPENIRRAVEALLGEAKE